MYLADPNYRPDGRMYDHIWGRDLDEPCVWCDGTGEELDDDGNAHECFDIPCGACNGTGKQTPEDDTPTPKPQDHCPHGTPEHGFCPICDIQPGLVIDDETGEPVPVAEEPKSEAHAALTEEQAQLARAYARAMFARDTATTHLAQFNQDERCSAIANDILEAGYDHLAEFCMGEYAREFRNQLLAERGYEWDSWSETYVKAAPAEPVPVACPSCNGQGAEVGCPSCAGDGTVMPEPAITEEMMLGTSVFQGDHTVTAHYIPNGGQSIIMGYSLATPHGFACFGIRENMERVRLEPAYVDTLPDATALLRDDAFAYAARERQEVTA